MRILEVDERRSSWEDHAPVFRVYLFRGGERQGTSWTTWTYDVEDADLLETAQWAEAQVAGEGLYAVALVSHASPATQDAGGPGLVWLIGHDANCEPDTPRQHASRERMEALRSRPLTR